MNFEIFVIFLRIMKFKNNIFFSFITMKIFTNEFFYEKNMKFLLKMNFY